MMYIEEATDYYMSEGCAIFAIVLHRIFGYNIASYLDDYNEDFTDEDGESLPGIVHVFTYVDNQIIDVKGIRNLQDLKNDFYDVNGRVDWKVSEREILEEYSGDEDSRLYKISKKDINEATRFINKHIDMYKI